MKEALKLALEALKKCDSALAEELMAWDIDPPLHHVLEASNACGPAITAIEKALAQPEPCQCPNCKVTLHASDCAVHNEPAYPKGECNCGAQQYNATSDYQLMENAQGDLERIKLVQTGVGIGKPEQKPVAWESLLGAVARGWCYEENANKTMDSDLAVAIAKEVQALYTTPPQPEQNLNCKSTQARLATAWGYVKAQPKEPEQEPVASYCRECLTYNGHQEGCSHYINNPIRNQLTNEQILEANYPDGEENGPTIAAPDFELVCFARAIEAAHGIKE